MSIQQSLNQILGTAGIAGALYANTPAGKERFEINKLTRKIDQTRTSYDNMPLYTDIDEMNKTEEEKLDLKIQRAKQGQKFAGQEADMLEERSKISPKTAEEDFRDALFSRQYVDEFQSDIKFFEGEKRRLEAEKKPKNNIIQSLIQKIANIQDQKTALMSRKEILKEFKDKNLISNRQYKKLDYKLSKTEKEEANKNV